MELRLLCSFCLLFSVIGHSSRGEGVVYDVGTPLGIGNSVWLWEWLVLNSSLTNLLDLLFLPFEILFLCWLGPLGWIRNLYSVCKIRGFLPLW